MLMRLIISLRNSYFIHLVLVLEIRSHNKVIFDQRFRYIGHVIILSKIVEKKAVFLYLSENFLFFFTGSPNCFFTLHIGPDCVTTFEAWSERFYDLSLVEMF